MSDRFKWALSPTNLALLGALDDFYDVYCSIIDIYNEHANCYYDENGKEKTLTPWALDNLARRDVRKACEPLLNKHLHIFSEKYNRIFANAYGFSAFSFFCVPLSPTNDFVFKQISFSAFLVEIERAVIRIIYRWKSKETPCYDLENLAKEINSHIENLAKNKRKEYLENSTEQKATTNATLFLFDRLSSTRCYKSNHPVMPKSFVADLINDRGKIALPVHYCNYCKKYFIGKKTLSLFEKTYGKLFVEKRMACELDNDFTNFRTESKLHRLGYNVIEGDMTKEERQKRLIYLLEHNKISYLEICSTIEQNILMFKNSYRHAYAITKWQEDLKFIGDYILATKRNE